MTPVLLRPMMVATLVLLGACGSEPQAPPQLPYAVSGARLTVDQVGRDCTVAGGYRADVAWQVAETLPATLEVRVGTGELQVFARSNERSGSERTGDWVNAGTVFHLFDRDGEELLAATRADAGDCAGTARP